jgi:ABC-type lipoprotein export system ATPase subunit
MCLFTSPFAAFLENFFELFKIMIQTNSISKTYRSGRGTIQALSDVSISIPGGATLAVAGKSGSGKTTLLNCIGGLERPDNGNVNCFGVDIHTLSRRELSYFQRRNMGFVFQFGNLLSYLTVFENISFPLVLNNMEKEKRVAELLEKIGLPEVISAMPYELSGGETQRIAFARAIAHSPKMLLADEPTANLDTETGEILVKYMYGICKEEGCAIIISTHDQRLINLSDKTYTLLDGKVIGE